MAGRAKSFIVGLIVGGIIAFMLGINYGRDRPLLSNPFAARDLGESVKEKAESIVEGAREKLHKATQPEPGKR